MPDNGLMQTNNEALWSAIINVQKILETDYLMQIDAKNEQHFSALYFLAGCILLFRFGIERDKYHLNSFVPELANLIFKCIQFSLITRELERLEIYGFFKLWLHQYLWEWARFSKQGKYFSLAEFPDADAFSKDVNVFNQRLKEGEARCKNDIANGSISDFSQRPKLT